MKRWTTSFTSGDRASRESRAPFVSLRTDGTWIATSRTAPTKTPHASAWAIPTWVAPYTPAATTKAIWVAFHITGDTYDRKNCRWLLRIPVQ